MDRIWFVIKENDHIGPYTVEELQLFLDEGKIHLTTLVWASGMPAPLPLDSLLEGGKEYTAADPDFSLPPTNEDLELEEHSYQPDPAEQDLSYLGLKLSTLDDDPFFDPKEDQPAFEESEHVEDIQVKVIESDDFQDSFDESELEALLQNQNEDELSLQQATLEEEMPPAFNPPVEKTIDKKIEKPILKTESLNVARPIKIESNIETTPIDWSLIWQKYTVKLLFAIPILVLFVLVGRISTEIYQIYFSQFKIPAKMDIEHYEMLSSYLKRPGKNNPAKAVFSKDYSTLWMATTYPFDGRIDIKLEAIPEKLLAEKPVTASAVGLLENKLISVNQFKFSQGERFYPGYYRIRFSLINRFKKTYWLEKIINLPALFEGETEILVGPFDPITFNNKLAEYRKSKEQDDLHFKQELKQRFETLKTINTEIHAELLKTMRDVSDKNKLQLISLFEQAWAQKYGVFLTQFVLENDQFFKDLLNSQSSRTSRYYSLHAKLSQWCKQIGELSMQLIKELKEEKNLKMYQSSDFRQTATKKLEEIDQEIAREINQI
jgi:hypothetical protein